MPNASVDLKGVGSLLVPNLLLNAALLTSILIASIFRWVGEVCNLSSVIITKSSRRTTY